MKVIRISEGGGLENLIREEMQSQVVGPGEVRVAWHATSLNYHDLWVAKGLIPVEAGRIPMSDGAGEILEVGEGVTKWQAGDRVLSLFFPDWHDGRPTRSKTTSISGESVDGYLREEGIISAQSLTRMPQGLSFGEAATLPCAGLTAWRGLFEERPLSAGQKVLVEGAGGVSIFALQFAQAAGAEVYATSSSDDKLARMKDMGAVYGINYRQEERWGRAIFKQSGGIDHVIDVGGGSTFSHSVDAVAMDGHIASIGILDGRSGDVVFPKLFFKHIHITGLAVGSREMQERMVDFVDKHQIKPIVDKSFGFEQLGEAFTYQQTGQHFGKIVLEW